MGAKAVYNNQSVMIYITGPEAAALLKDGALIMPCYIGSEYAAPSACYVELAPEIVIKYNKQRQAEIDAIQAVKDQLRAVNPDAAANPSRQRERKRKRAKRITSPDVSG